MKGLATGWKEVPERAVEPEKPPVPKQRESKRTSQVDALIKIANGWEFFHTPDHRTYVGVAVNDHSEIIAVRSRQFRAFLKKTYHKNNSKSASSASIEEASIFLKARHCAAHKWSYIHGWQRMVTPST